MTDPAKSVPHADVLSGPDANTRASSEEGLRPTMISDSKEDIESAQPLPAVDEPIASTLPQFPEGGLQAWLTVIGGYVHHENIH